MVTTQRADAAANRRRIIDTAGEVFQHRGVNAEMREIAERAGLGVGTLYRNFASKDDLIVQIMNEALERGIEEANAAEGLADPIEALYGVVRASLRISERIGWALEANLAGHLSRRTREKLAADGRQFDSLSRVRRALQRAVSAGRLREDLDVELAAIILRGSFSYTTLRSAGVARDFDSYARNVVALLLAGIGMEHNPSKTNGTVKVKERKGNEDRS